MLLVFVFVNIYCYFWFSPACSTALRPGVPRM
jgi:hypothetical protein